MKLAATSVNTKDIFGTVNPPPGSDFAKSPNALGTLFSNAILVFIVIAELIALIYLLWGALDWITSGGDKEKLLKARKKIQNAIIGLLIIFAALVIFNVLVGIVLGGRIIQSTGNGFQFTLPTVDGSPSSK